MFTLTFIVLVLITIVSAVAAIVLFKQEDNALAFGLSIVLGLVALIGLSTAQEELSQARFKAQLEATVYTCEGYTTSAVQKEFLLCMDKDTRIVENRHLGNTRGQYIADLDLIQIRDMSDESALLHEAVHATLKNVQWPYSFFSKEAKASGYVERITKAMHEQNASIRAQRYILDTEEMLARTVEACSGLDINSSMLDMYPTEEEKSSLCEVARVVLAEANFNRANK